MWAPPHVVGSLRGIVRAEGDHGVDHTELFAKRLRSAPPWRVTRVRLDVADEHVDV